MALKDFELSKERQEKALQWFSDKIPPPGMRCSACGKSGFTMMPNAGTMPLHQEGRTVLGGPSFLYITLMCDNCANTFHFNAVKMGLFPPSNESDGGDAT